MMINLLEENVSSVYICLTILTSGISYNFLIFLYKLAFNFIFF